MKNIAGVQEILPALVLAFANECKFTQILFGFFGDIL